MKSLVVEPSGPETVKHTVRIAKTDIDIAAGECRVAVRRAGICGTDLQILEGYAGFAGVPGHEFMGTVENVTVDVTGRPAGLMRAMELVRPRARW